MNRADVESEVKGMLCKTLAVSSEEINDSSHIMNDLGASSVDIVDMLSWVEEEFDIEIDDDDAQGMRTFGNVVDFICERKSVSG